MSNMGYDSLFVGLTRPPMLMGASYMFTGMNFIINMMVYVITTNFKMALLAVPIQLIGYYFCSKEPRVIELFQVKAEKCSRCVNKFYHGANSYDPY